MEDSKREKFDDATRLHQEAVEKFRAADKAARERLANAATVQERIDAISDGIEAEAEAVEQADRAIEMMGEAIDDSES